MKFYYSPSTAGFYNSSINKGKIPQDAIEITDAYLRELQLGQSNGWFITADDKGYPILTKSAFNFEFSMGAKNTEIRAAFQTAMSPITANYTPEDIVSFPTQQAEATAWQADNAAETPLLDAMVANRPSIDKATLVSRILANAVIYKQVAGPAIGKKQHFEDLLYALKAQHEDPEQPDVTQADFDAIVVDFS